MDWDIHFKYGFQINVHPHPIQILWKGKKKLHYYYFVVCSPKFRLDLDKLFIKYKVDGLINMISIRFSAKSYRNIQIDSYRFEWLVHVVGMLRINNILI